LHAVATTNANSRLSQNAPCLSASTDDEATMAHSKRTFLLAAGGAGLALVGAGSLFAVTRRPASALTAWDAIASTTADVRLDAFRHAILAPNPHNRQPWQIRLVGRDDAIITCDLDRRLPQTDPYDRQITMGFGCFLELARIAAAERGYRMDTTLFPDGEPQPRLTAAAIARLRFVAEPKTVRDPLYSVIAKRRSSKVPFDMARKIDPAMIAGLAQQNTGAPIVAASAEPAVVKDIRDLTWRAWMIEAVTPRTWMESVDLMRIGRAEIEANPDGIALGGAFIEALALAGQINRKALGDPTSTAFKGSADRYKPMLEQTPAYLWISTLGNTRADQIAAGRMYVRANLEVTVLGLNMHPVSQALQEFPEMAAELDALHRKLGVKAPGRIQMLARLGYGATVNATVRWPLEAKLLTR
jgi:hypothetical protein